MAKKAQIQQARPLRMLVESASIFVSYVPASFHLMDTKSYFAPWDSKVHILVSTRAGVGFSTSKWRCENING